MLFGCKCFLSRVILSEEAWFQKSKRGVTKVASLSVMAESLFSVPLNIAISGPIRWMSNCDSFLPSPAVPAPPHKFTAHEISFKMCKTSDPIYRKKKTKKKKKKKKKKNISKYYLRNKIYMDLYTCRS